MQFTTIFKCYNLLICAQKEMFYESLYMHSTADFFKHNDYLHLSISELLCDWAKSYKMGWSFMRSLRS
jgi:hypothetical protein